jgi:hypothetical protein
MHYPPAGDRPLLRFAQFVLKLADFDAGSDIAQRGRVHDLLHPSQRGSSVASAGTLTERFRRYRDASHMSLLSSLVVVAVRVTVFKREL